MSQTCESYLAEHEERLVDDLCEFLRIPSVSALPAHDADVARAADWVAERLRQAEVPEVTLLPTGR
ncbi:MAG: peptidase M20, partial [Chloroflexota bacterium]|nr:peptidase M20 [Chloroflexota bacterium]